MRLTAAGIDALGLGLGLLACQTSTSAYGRAGASTSAVPLLQSDFPPPRITNASQIADAASAVALPKGQNLHV